MANQGEKVPVKTESGPSPSAKPPARGLREQINHLFDAFESPWTSPFGRLLDAGPDWKLRLPVGPAMPATDLVEHEKEFQVTAELPGMDEKDIEIKLSNGNLVIKGEKRENIEEKKKDYYLSERRYGAFERVFHLPKGIDAEKIDASFAKGVLTVSMPKKPEAIKPEKVIPVKAS